tara:strand:- start:187589 stop:187870 length:282 start_codon:yes stop_codon:yes gene_type:complete
MAIPDGVRREHFLAAITKFEQLGMPAGFKPSHTYDVEHDGKSYPPPAIIAYAIEAVTGELPKPGFPVGKGAKSFRLITECGFTIRDKRKHQTD